MVGKWVSRNIEFHGKPLDFISINTAEDCVPYWHILAFLPTNHLLPSELMCTNSPYHRPRLGRLKPSKEKDPSRIDLPAIRTTIGLTPPASNFKVIHTTHELFRPRLAILTLTPITALSVLPQSAALRDHHYLPGS